MPDYWSYLAMRIITAVGAVGLFNSSFTMTIELMGSKEVLAIILKFSNKLRKNCNSDCALASLAHI